MPILDTAEVLRRDGFSCGAVSLDVLYRYHGYTLPRAYWDLSNPARGMAPETAEAAIRAQFVGVSWGQGWEIADLSHHIKLGRPVMCLVSEAEAADHWVLVRGVQRGRVYYHDPSNGRESKKIADWLKWWTGPKDNAYSGFGLTGWPATDQPA